ncbi:MAG: RNA-guided endonuclease InsQ/TnpB family protein [Waterburya sp.]
MIYGCQQDRLKLERFEQRVIEYLCRQANSLTNCAIYALKRSFRQSGQIDYNYYDLDKHLKPNKHYKCLFSQVAQQVLISVCESFKSHFEVMQCWYRGELEDKPKMPRYRKSGGMSGFTYPAQHLRLNETLETGLIRLPLGAEIGIIEGIKEIYIRAPKNIHPEKIKEVRIFPRNKCFYVEWVYQREKQIYKLDQNKALGIDSGVKNWLTCVSNTGDSFIIDGKKPNFWNRTLNREVAKHNRGFWSKKLALMTEKRNRRLKDYINKTARTIANYCIDSGTGTVVFGWNEGNKQKVNLGKRNNQNFYQLPTAKLKERLKVVLTEIGVNFVEVNEAYTSKASFLDNDLIPKYGEKPENWKSSGKRIATKLYQTAQGWICNADAQAAANILKVASIPGIGLGEITRGVVTRPVRLNLYAPVLI